MPRRPQLRFITRRRRSGAGSRTAELTEALLLALMVLAVILILRPGPGAARASVEPTTALVDEPRLIGVGRVIDGDTLDVGSVRVRLHGIDAFERDQMCDRNARPWACGAAAAAALKSRAEGRRLECQVLDTDRYGRMVSRCQRDGVDVAEALVSDGLALAYRRYSQDYLDEERTAQMGRIGAWDGSFDRPEQWRSRSRTGLGAS